MLPLLLLLTGCSRSEDDQKNLADDLFAQTTDLDGFTESDQIDIAKTHSLSESEALYAGRFLRHVASSGDATIDDCGDTECSYLRSDRDVFKHLVGEQNYSKFSGTKVFDARLRVFEEAKKDGYLPPEIGFILDGRIGSNLLFRQRFPLTYEVKQTQVLYFSQVLDVLKDKDVDASTRRQSDNALLNYIKQQPDEVRVTDDEGWGSWRDEVSAFRHKAFDLAKAEEFEIAVAVALMNHADMRQRLLTCLQSTNPEEVVFALTVLSQTADDVVLSIIADADMHQSYLEQLKSILTSTKATLGLKRLAAKVLEEHPHFDPNGEALAGLVKSGAYQAVVNVLDRMSQKNNAEILARDHRSVIVALAAAIRSDYDIRGTATTASLIAQLVK